MVLLLVVIKIEALMKFAACLSQISSGGPELWPPEVALLGQKSENLTILFYSLCLRSSKDNVHQFYTI